MIDLSDLDPYSPTAHSATAAPSRATVTVNVAPTPPVATPIDPLASRLGRINLGTMTTTTASSSSSSLSSSRASSRTRSPGPLPPSLTAVNAAQRERNDRILTDLAREPFAAPSSSSSALLPLTDEPASIATTTNNASPPPAPVAVSSPPARRRPSRSGHPTGSNGGTTTTMTGFSPPRRLSSLMDFHSTAAAAAAPANEHAGVSSPPVESSAMADPFHPIASSRPHEAARRIRQLSFSSSSPPPSSSSHAHPWHLHGHSTSPTTTSVGQHLDSSAEWGEFQDADVVDLAGSLAAATTSSPSSGGPSSPTRSRQVPGPSADSRSHTLPSFPSLPFSTASLPSALGGGRADSFLPKQAAVAANGFVASLFNSLGDSSRNDAPPPPPPPLAPSLVRRHPVQTRKGDQPPSLQSRTTAPPDTTTARTKTAPPPPSAFDPTAQPVKLVGLRPGVVRVLDEDVAEGVRFLPPLFSPPRASFYSIFLIRSERPWD